MKFDNQNDFEGAYIEAAQQRLERFPNIRPLNMSASIAGICLLAMLEVLEIDAPEFFKRLSDKALSKEKSE